MSKGAQMHHLHTGWTEKLLPHPPSPTLTNPDHILPTSDFPLLSSPPRSTRRPLSPSYLRDANGDPAPTRAPGMAKGKKEKLGLMSRKMMLLRARTASGGTTNGSGTPPSQRSIDVDFIPSLPVLQDVGHLAPEQPEYLQLPELDRTSGSPGSSSSDLSGLNGFLARCAKPDGTSDDEALNAGESSPALMRCDSSIDQETDLDAERRKQQQEEYNSAILSKRAEQILANAKKRLNAMEGNLRGARDLVAPLTAANLERATSLGSAHDVPAYDRRYVSDGYDYTGQGLPSSRRLHSQASSPLIGRDYQGHTRRLHDTGLTERPYTSLDDPYYMSSRGVLMPQATIAPLRGSRSYDSLGGSSGRDRSLHYAQESPDSNHLEPLSEADEGRRSNRNSRNDAEAAANNGLGIYCPSSRTSDLREQLNSLKGKISTLKERAREDSLRRQSQAQLRDSSPLNNATAAAPEFFYTSSHSYGSPTLDENASVGWTSKTSSPASPPTPQMWEDGLPVTGSRNASAEQATVHQQHVIQQARVVDLMATKTSDSKFQVPVAKTNRVSPQGIHRRTPSGSLIVGSARSRYSHHQQKRSERAAVAYESEDDDYLGIPAPDAIHEQYDTSQYPFKATPDMDDDYAPSEDGESVFEDAQYEQKPVVAHEYREDAFDYEHFFLHSALGTYSNGRRGSASSETSVSSASTAKGPALVSEDSVDAFDHDSVLYAPATPETPERLKEVERNLHRRSSSDESVSTLATYATADEDPEDPADELPISPIDEPQRQLVSPEHRSISPSESDTGIQSQRTMQMPGSLSNRPSSRPSSRLNSAVRRGYRRNSGSQRADSGVGMSHRSAASIDSQRPLLNSCTPKLNDLRSPSSAINSPPVSPQGGARQDPVSVAVNALFNPDGRQLGLRNKAVVFGVVESLRKVVNMLQQEDETGCESRVLSRRLEEAKAVLDARGLS